MKHLTPLLPGQYYHVYNRGNNRENLFRDEPCYRRFLLLYAQHIEPIADTFAYCLLPNHFHLLLRVRPDLDAQVQTSRVFAHLFNAYARWFNLRYDRRGALFQRPFQRIAVSDEAYFARLVVYIHQNPQRHGLIADFRDWPFSSYNTLEASEKTRLCREAVLAWFGDREQYTAAHTGSLVPVDDEDDLTSLGESANEQS